MLKVASYAVILRMDQNARADVACTAIEEATETALMLPALTVASQA